VSERSRARLVDAMLALAAVLFVLGIAAVSAGGASWFAVILGVLSTVALIVAAVVHD
jgi:hypothetical protein